MSEFKGTRGPWEVKPEEVDKHYIRIRGTNLGRRFKIANVLTPIYDGVNEREANETRANAQLIAVAPELLQELQRLEVSLNTIKYCYEKRPENMYKALEVAEQDCERARVIIAKALGEA